MDRPVIICGLGKVGWRVLDSVRAAGLPVVVVDTHTAPDDPRLKGVKAIKGDCRQLEVLEQAGIREAGGVVLATSDDLVNISTAFLVRSVNPTARLVVRMFNQNLLTRLGLTVNNTVALSVSALTAPILALAAVSGDALGAFKLEEGSRQVVETVVAEGSELSGKTIAAIAESYRLLPLALRPREGEPRFLLDVPADVVLSPGDRFVFCGAPADIQPLLARERGDIFPGIRWAGRVRRWVRTARRTLWEVDLSVKIATPALFATILASTLVFRYGLDTDWTDGLYNTVSLVATGAELHGEHKPGWAKVFLSVLKIAGAALVAGFTAIFTQYLIRARLGGALEVRRVPDGGHVVVCGLGNVGYRLVEELTAMGERIVALDIATDNPFLATVRRKGVPTFIGDATVPEALKQANAGSAKAVIAATSSELANLEIALLVREMNPKQRVVLRLNDPQFAQAVRAASRIRYALSIPALAAPAFTAALFGDRVQLLFTAAGRTLVVIDVVVDPGDQFLEGKSLRALSLDYRLLPVSAAGRSATLLRDYRLKAGDRVTVVSELTDLERFVRREAVPAASAVVVESWAAACREFLVKHLTQTRGLLPEQAEAILNAGPFMLQENLTNGMAQELMERLAGEGVKAGLR